MRYEPAVDRPRLMQTVWDAYGVPAQGLRFVPEGFVAACYVVDEADGSRLFLKLWPQLCAGQAAAGRLHGSLVLTRALYDRGLVPNVSYPLPTREGALWAEFSGSPFAVFPLLPGKAPPARLPPALWEEFARVVAAIHRATPALADVLPPRETFAIPDEAELGRCLAVVERIGSGERPGLRVLRRLMLLRQADVLAQYGRLRRLQGVVRRLDGPSVLCHTDLGGNNMLVDDEGRLSVLDWDDPIVAPPEYDLWSALGEGLASILSAYRREGGAQPLHIEHFEFYLLRRYLGDMTARLERILDEGHDEEEDEELLRGMEAYGFARWAALDGTLATIAEALRESDGHAC